MEPGRLTGRAALVGLAGACVLVTACDFATIVTLDPLVVGAIGGQVTVTGIGGEPNVTVRLSGTQVDSAVTDAAGSFSFPRLAGGSYTVRLAGYPGGLTFSSTQELVQITENGESIDLLFEGAYPPVVLETTSLAVGQIAVPYADTLLASGGPGTYTWSVTLGSLPPGLSLDPSTGIISGTPTAVGSRIFTVQVTAATGTRLRQLAITVFGPGLSVVTTALVDGEVGVLYADTLESIGGVDPRTWSIINGSLPPGLALDVSTGVIDGTPTSRGAYPFDARVATADDTATVSLSIDVTPPTLAPSQLCRNFPPSFLATFEDPNLDGAVRTALGLGPQDDLTCALVGGLTTLAADSLGIGSLVGAQNLTSVSELTLVENSISGVGPLSGLTALIHLDLSFNSISNVAPLASLTALEYLALTANLLTDISSLSSLVGLQDFKVNLNSSLSDISAMSSMTNLVVASLGRASITDISPLSGLTALFHVGLDGNVDLADIQALLSNPGVASGDNVRLAQTSVACADVASLSAKGVAVVSDCGPTVLQPQMRCWTFPPESIATFEDAMLEGVVRAALGLSAQDDLTCAAMTASIPLEAHQLGITSYAGLHNMVNMFSFGAGGNPVSDLSPFSGLDSLVLLHVWDNAITDLSPLSGLTSLKNLSLGGNAISDVSPLSGLTNLNRLLLWWNSISDIGPLSGLTALDTLSADGNAISDLSPLTGLTGLKRLELRDNQISDLNPLSALTSLEYLMLARNSISDVSALSSLTNLLELDLGGNTINDISPLAGLTSLTGLALHEQPTLSDISVVSNLTNLQTLQINSTGVTSVVVLSGLTNLQGLYLNASPIADLTPLAGLTNLTILHVSGLPATDYTVVGGFTLLTDLDIGGPNLTDIAILTGLTNLTWLRMSDAAITDISVLQGLTNLETLWLDNIVGLTDIQPLLDNPGLGAGDWVDLTNTAVSCTDVAALEAKGVTVVAACP